MAESKQIKTLAEFSDYLAEHNFPAHITVSQKDFMAIWRRLQPGTRTYPLMWGATTVYVKQGPDLDVSDTRLFDE